MNKKEEIGMLEVLRTSDSYFNDTFESKDILLMQRNIEDDMPLLLGTGYVKLDKVEIVILCDFISKQIQKTSTKIYANEEYYRDILDKLKSKLEKEG